MVKGFEEYAYLGSFEALLCEMFPTPTDLPCSELEYGQGEFFNEQGFVVQYFKEEPLYERSYSKKQDGRYFKSAGIIQILYQSPIGNFVIKQNQLNNRIFEIYVSEDISEMLLEKLSKALEIALDIKSESIERNFRERYKVRGDSTSPNIELQKPKDALLARDIEDSRDEK